MTLVMEPHDEGQCWGRTPASGGEQFPLQEWAALELVGGGNPELRGGIQEYNQEYRTPIF